jgi:hypothetical protein
MLRIALTLVYVVCASSAHAGWFSYDSYEDCMLGRMKGQDRSLYQHVDRLCRREFKVITPIELWSIVWRVEYCKDCQAIARFLQRPDVLDPAGGGTESADKTLSVVLDRVPNSYRVLDGDFVFSWRSCGDSKDSDFGHRETIYFVEGKSEPLPAGVQCIRAVSFEGVVE